MDKHVQVIRDAYYNVNSPACFAGADTVLRECKKKNKRITKKEVDDFLAKQETYTLHRQTRRRFNRNTTRTAGLDVDWQADLADMRHLKHWNSGFTFLLICVDVLSRFAFVVPVKRKTPVLVAEAFKSIIKTGRKPWKLSTDRGLEFRGKPFQDFLKSEFISHWYATSPDVKCAIAERYIRTLKSRIWKYFTRNKTKRYIDVLPELVAAINNSYHRTIKRAPSSVNRTNQNEVWESLYEKKKPIKPRFKSGDRVRITIEKHVLSKGYRQNFSKEVLVVSKLLRRQPPTYKITDDEGEEIEGVFYNEEMVRVLPDDAVRKIQSVKKTEKRDEELWHLVKYEDKKESWVRNSEFVSI